MIKKSELHEAKRNEKQFERKETIESRRRKKNKIKSNRKTSTVRQEKHWETEITSFERKSLLLIMNFCVLFKNS